MAIKLAELPNGVELTQATEDTAQKSNIYCELPYCSADSKRFVFQQQNPDGAPNTTEYVTCEFGTWATEIVGRGLGGPGMTHNGTFFYRRIVEGKCVPPELIQNLNNSSVIYFDKKVPFT